MEKITQLKDGRIRVETINDEPSLTQQQYAKQCDINEILSQYQKTGEINFKNANQGQYLDLLELPDYQQSLDIVHRAQEAFMQLPAQARKRFQNDPYEMISFLQDPENQQEAIRLGMLIPKPETNEQNDTKPKTETASPKPS